MASKSILTAVAKWDHKQKDQATAGWLSFKSNEKITNIGFPYQDYWAWSGCNSKGKYGIFPKAFVGELLDSKTSPASSSKPLIDRWAGQGTGLGNWSGVSPITILPQKKVPHRKTASKASEVSIEAEKEVVSPGGTMTGMSPTVASGSGSASGGGWSLGRVTSLPFGRRSTNASRSSDGGKSTG
jgi:hypothetical protein